MALRKDIEIRDNSSYRLEFQWLNRDGTPKDISGSQVKMQIRNEPGGETLHGTWTNGNGFVFDGPSGSIALTIPKSATSVFNFNTATYDIAITWPDTSTDVILYGDVAMVRGVTV